MFDRLEPQAELRVLPLLQEFDRIVDIMMLELQAKVERRRLVSTVHDPRSG